VAVGDTKNVVFGQPLINLFLFGLPLLIYNIFWNAPMTQRRTLLLPLVCISLLAASAILPLHLASAAPHRLTADEIMALVNELRRSQGLQPYSIDPGITAYAQEHSEYQALTDTSTHLHSDGQVSLAHGYVENVAGGDVGYLTADAIVYEIWNDPVHMKTMVGYESGAAGVGVASNNTTTFVTLNVRPGDSAAAPDGASGSSQASTPIPLVPLITATMRPDGAIIHEVGYGQSLWAIAIAYGVTSARIRELNGMAPNDSAIWAGQRLLIVPAGLATPTQSIAVQSIDLRVTDAEPAEVAALTASDLPPTVTRTALRVSTSTPRATRTPFQTLTATSTSSTSPASPDSGLASQIKIDPVLAGLAGLATLGFLLFVFSSVKK
jgi:uncharacterized protein YkwD/LysM repeat protein